MSTTATAFKKKVITKAENAAAGAPPMGCGPNCQACRRVDLQLLVITPSVVAREHAAALAAAKTTWNGAFDAEFGAVARKATVPVARIARPGYFMVYYVKRERWDVWQVMDFGLTRKIMHQVNTAAYGSMLGPFAKAPPAKSCSRQAANLKAQLISIEGASAIEEVWVAYTDTLWTRATLQRYAKNPTVEGKPLRDQRGRTLNPKAILGGALPTGGLRLDTGTLQNHVADFASASSAGFNAAFAGALKPLDAARFGKAAAFAEEVRQIEKGSGPAYLEKSVVLMVPDPIGVIVQHNKLRMAVVGAKQAWMAGGPDATGKNADPARAWKRQSQLNAGYIREWTVIAEHQRMESFVEATHDMGRKIDEAEYQRVQKMLASKAERTWADNLLYGHPETVFVPLPGEPRMYQVRHPSRPEVLKKRAEMIKLRSDDRKERYNKHLNWPAIKDYNTAWLAQQDGWDALLAARDQDYVTWLSHKTAGVVFEYDFDDSVARQKAKRKPDELWEAVYDAVTLLDTTARCYGGGGLSDPSIRHLIGEFERDECDTRNRVGRAFISKFSLADKVKSDPGTQADFVDVGGSTHDGFNEFIDAWDEWKSPAASSATILANLAVDTTNRLEQVAVSPQLATRLKLQATLRGAASKQVVWIRATAYHKYLLDRVGLYNNSVRWNSKAFLAAAPTEKTLHTSAVEMGEDKSHKKQAKSYKNTQKHIQAYLASLGPNKDVTIPLFFDQAAMNRAALLRGERMLNVVSPGLFGGHPQVTQLPESFVNSVVVQQKEFKWDNIGKHSLYFNGFVMMMQGRALKQSYDEIFQKGGMDQVDAVASGLAGVVGVAGAVAEMGAIMMTPVAGGEPAAFQLASSIPKHLRWQYAAGLLAAAGAMFDCAVSVARSINKENQGDSDAAQMFRGAAGAQLIGGLALGAGSYYAYQAALINRLGTEMTMQLLGRAMSPLMLARCLTGLGLLLWLGGLAVSFIAMYLEDDANELHLRRSIFGKGHPQLGKYQEFKDEMQSFQALSLGCSAAIEWNDEYGDDEVTAIVKVFRPKPENVINVALEGFSSINGKLIKTIYNGPMPAPQPEKDSDDGLCKTSKVFKVPGEVSAVRLTYWLYENNKSFAAPAARGEMWLED